MLYKSWVSRLGGHWLGLFLMPNPALKFLEFLLVAPWSDRWLINVYIGFLSFLRTSEIKYKTFNVFFFIVSYMRIWIVLYFSRSDVAVSIYNYCIVNRPWFPWSCSLWSSQSHLTPKTTKKRWANMRDSLRRQRRDLALFI